MYFYTLEKKGIFGLKLQRIKLGFFYWCKIRFRFYIVIQNVSFDMVTLSGMFKII